MLAQSAAVVDPTMGLGLLQHPGVKPWTQAHSGSGIPAKLGDLNALSRFPEKRGKRVPLVAAGRESVQNFAVKWLSKRRQIGQCAVEFSQLGLARSDRAHAPRVPASDKAETRLGSARKAAKKLAESGQREAEGGWLEVGNQQLQEGCRSQGLPTVTCAGRGSGEPETSDRYGRLFRYSAAGASAAVFAEPVWGSCRDAKPNRPDSGGGAGRDAGSGGDGCGGGGGGSDGGGGDGSGDFEANSAETLIKDVVENSESRDDEEQQPTLETPYRIRNFGVLASLSSAAGEAFDGEAPFGDLPFGRNKRAGVGQKGAKVPSKAPAESGSAGGVLGKIDKAAQDCFNFLAPNTAQEGPGFQGSFSGDGPSRGKENKREALAEDVATRAMQLIQEKDGDDAPVKRSETAALRRLQREAFADLLKARERLDKLEYHTGLRHSKTAPSALGEAAKTRLKGEVCAGGAFVLLNDKSSRWSRAALEHAGLHTGLDVRFTFETSYRAKDVMITECSAGHAGSDGSILGGPISVTKLVYNAQVTDDLTVVVAPLGARGSDITETVNPLQGQALTEFARVGPALYNYCVGSALGATLRGKSALLSVSQYLSDWGTGSSFPGGLAHTGPLCLSTLAQIMFQPWENSVFSLSAVNRFWPSPPLPSFTGLHWSEMGPLVLSKTSHNRRPSAGSPPLGSPRELRTSIDNPSGFSVNASWGTPFGEADGAVVAGPESHGTAMQSVAVAGEIYMGANMSLGGWAQVERGDLLQEGEKRDVEWSVSLAKALGKSAGWGVCVGSSKVDLWSVGRSEDSGYFGAGDDSDEACGTQLQVEAFLKLRMGRGFTLQPGLVYLLNKQSQTPAFMVRSSWAL